MIVRTMGNSQRDTEVKNTAKWARLYEELDGYEVVELRPCQFVIVEKGVFDTIISHHEWYGVSYDQGKRSVVRTMVPDGETSVMLNKYLARHYKFTATMFRKTEFYRDTNYLDYTKPNYTNRRSEVEQVRLSREEFYKRCPKLRTTYGSDVEIATSWKENRRVAPTCFIPEKGYKHIVYSKGDKGYTFRVRLRYMAGCSVPDWMRPVFETPEEAEEARKKLLDDQRALVGDFEGLPVVKQAI